MRPQRLTFGRMYANAGYTAKYRREIRRIIKAMHEDTRREIRILYNDTTYDAPVTLTQIMAKLRKRWYKIFTKRAKEMNRWLVETVKKRTRKDIMKQLKDIGMALTPHWSDSEKAVIDNIVTTGVDLIVTIPKAYFREVQETVRDAVERGGDRAAIKEAIIDKFDHPAVNRKPGESAEDALARAERRAELIAKDQVQKATQEFAMENAKAYGATKAEWIHIPGEKSSRITHIHMDGEVFEIDKGLYDEDVGRFVKPGELIYCMCSCSFLFPGTD